MGDGGQVTGDGGAVKNRHPSPDTRNLICIAKIASAHGVKGLVKILPYCEDVSLIERVEAHAITLKNALGKYILAEIEGVESREAAEALAGAELYVPRDALPEADEGEYYYEDLVGLSAINAQSGKEAGVVAAVQNYGAGDLLEIQAKSGETYLLPFTDAHVPEVDIAAGFVKIIPLEGL